MVLGQATGQPQVLTRRAKQPSSYARYARAARVMSRSRCQRAHQQHSHASRRSYGCAAVASRAAAGRSGGARRMGPPGGGMSTDVHGTYDELTTHVVTCIIVVPRDM